MSSLEGRHRLQSTKFPVAAARAWKGYGQVADTAFCCRRFADTAFRRRAFRRFGVSPTRRFAARRFAAAAFRCRRFADAAFRRRSFRRRGVSPTHRFADAALRRTPFRRRGGVSPISLFTAWRFTDASPHDISPRTARSSGLKDRRGL